MKKVALLIALFMSLSLTCVAQDASAHEVEIAQVEWRAVMAITTIGGETFTNYIYTPPVTQSNQEPSQYFVTHEGQLPSISGRSGYLYRWDLRATLSSKKVVPIRAIEWEFWVAEQGLKKRVFRRREKLAGPAVGEVQLRGRYTPKRTFDNPSSVRPLTLGVQVTKVEYTDGTVWIWN